MGCGASKTDVVPANSVVPKTKKNSVEKLESKKTSSSLLSEGSTVSANDYYESKMNNGSKISFDKSGLPESLAHQALGNGEANDAARVLKLNRPEPVAFEVPSLDLDNEESLIRKHPPRRLRQKLDEQPETSPVLTQELLKEKVELANERRTQVLQKRVASARQKSARVINLHDNLPLTEHVENGSIE